MTPMNSAAPDDAFALALCLGAVLLAMGVMFLTPIVTRMTGQIRLHQPDLNPQWSETPVVGRVVPETIARDRAA
ncbi:MAG: hypothetical protein ACK5HA_14490 [Planctomycetaceae bacterium]|jgi:hypothetical protein